MSAGLKANNDGSAAIQVGGTDYIEISATGDVAIPQSLVVTGTITAGGIPVGGNYILRQYVAPATWTKPTGLKAVKVTVVGAGGNGGSTVAPAPTVTALAAAGGGGGGASIEEIQAASIPGPVAVTAGSGTNSFGAFCSATAGANGGNSGSSAVASGVGGAGGSGSGGDINLVGGTGGSYLRNAAPIQMSGAGGNSLLGQGGANRLAPNDGVGYAGENYGGGGGGAVGANPTPQAGGAGAPGIVIVEEFY